MEYYLTRGWTNCACAGFGGGADLQQRSFQPQYCGKEVIIIIIIITLCLFCGTSSYLLPLSLCRMASEFVLRWLRQLVMLLFVVCFLMSGLVLNVFQLFVLPFWWINRRLYRIANAKIVYFHWACKWEELWVWLKAFNFAQLSSFFFSNPMGRGEMGWLQYSYIYASFE